MKITRMSNSYQTTKQCKKLAFSLRLFRVRTATTGTSLVEFQAKSDFAAKLRLIMRKAIRVKKFS